MTDRPEQPMHDRSDDLLAGFDPGAPFPATPPPVAGVRRRGEQLRRRTRRGVALAAAAAVVVAVGVPLAVTAAGEGDPPSVAAGGLRAPADLLSVLELPPRELDRAGVGAWSEVEPDVLGSTCVPSSADLDRLVGPQQQVRATYGASVAAAADPDPGPPTSVLTESVARLDDATAARAAAQRVAAAFEACSSPLDLGGAPAMLQSMTTSGGVTFERVQRVHADAAGLRVETLGATAIGDRVLVLALSEVGDREQVEGMLRSLDRVAELAVVKARPDVDDVEDHQSPEQLLAGESPLALDDLPLTDGWSDDDEHVIDGPADTGSSYPPGEFCGGRIGWVTDAPRARLVTSYSARDRGSEPSQSRELQVYPSERAAEDAMAGVRTSAVRCPDFPTARFDDRFDSPDADDTVTFSYLYPGRTISGDPTSQTYRFVRVGRAILLHSVYGELVPGTVDRVLDEVAQSDERLVSLLPRVRVGRG